MKLALNKREVQLILWCVNALKEQHVKLMLEQDYEKNYGVDWVTKRSDSAMRSLKKAIAKAGKK